jgi:colicin import membrane protein
MTDATPYTVPKEPGRWRAITLAALVHIALLVFFWIGIRWQNETPATIEAEVWSPQVREAAPRPPEPEPEPKPVVKETPQREVPPPPVARPQPPVVKQPEKQPDIALEQEKKRKAREEAKRQERLEEERLAKQKQKAEEERQAKLKKIEEERLARQKKAEEEKLARQKEKAEEEKLAKKKEEAAKKAAAEKKRLQDEAETQALAKGRDEEMRRITGGVTGTGGSGDAARSQGSRGDPSYAQRVGAKIKSNINYNGGDELSGNPAVEYVVDLLPDGSVAGMRKTKSSGVPGFDEAVRRAIEKSQPFPKDKSGAVPSSFIGIHRPKDQ